MSEIIDEVQVHDAVQPAMPAFPRPCRVGAAAAQGGGQTHHVLQVGDVIYFQETPDGPKLRQIPEVSGALVSLNQERGVTVAVIRKET